MLPLTTIINQIFIIQRVKARAILCPHQPPSRGDNTVSVAQGGTGTPGSTASRFYHRTGYSKEIYIYIYTRSTKSRHYIGRSFIFI